MNTAQLLLSRHADTEQQKTTVPWIAGAIAVVLVLLIIVNIKK